MNPPQLILVRMVGFVSLTPIDQLLDKPRVGNATNPSEAHSQDGVNPNWVESTFARLRGR